MLISSRCCAGYQPRLTRRVDIPVIGKDIGRKVIDKFLEIVRSRAGKEELIHAVCSPSGGSMNSS